MKKFILLAALLPALAFGHGAPVIWNGTSAKWLPSGLNSAGVCKLSSSGVMTSGQADLTSNVTGILPLANGGTAKNMTPVAGGIVYTDSDSLEVTSAGTSGRAVVSGGTGAPTFFAPTVGSVIFAGTSGDLSQDNSSLFFDDTNNRLGLGTASPSGTLDVTNVADSIRGNIVLWGQGRSANSEWLIYDSPTGDVSLYNPNQGVYGWACRATGGCAAGAYSLGSADQMLGIRNNAGETTRHSLIIQKLTSQTGDFIRLRDTDNATVLAKIAIDGSATFNGVTSSLTGNVTGNLTGNVTGNLTGNADTATALAADPTDCSGNNWARGVAANGTAACAQPAFSNLSGSVDASQMPALTGDVTTSAGAVATTLATVNSNVGSFTNANITVNAKGLITAASSGSSGSTLDVSTKTADYTLTNSNDVILCNGSSADITITSHASASATKKPYRIKNIGTTNCIFDPNSSETIDGDSTLILPPGGAPQAAVTVIPDGGSAWYAF